MKVMLSNLDLVRDFVKNSRQKQEVLLANACLSGQTVCRSNQLTAKTEGVIMTASLSDAFTIFSAKANSSHWEVLNQALAENGYILTGEPDKRGFYLYKPCEVPEGYQLHCTKSVILWRAWWKYRKYAATPGISLKLLIRMRHTWYPVRDLGISDGVLYVKTLAHELTFTPEDLVIWLSKVEGKSV
ncbi:MAG TPA: hypothetical protein VK203_09065 [Nostocaceae cyanobacterium]|nr:hypothetical protein [Nostocaceae cyanobacterium]